MPAASEISREQGDVQARAINYLVSAMTGQQAASPVLYGPDNRPLPPARMQYAKRAASDTGSMRNWRPKQLNSEEAIIRQREKIQARVSDLVGSDPHAAGIVNSFPITVIGSGLYPYPSIDAETLNLTDEQATAIERQQRAIDARFWPYADHGGRMHMGMIEFLWEKSLMQYGESLTLVHMRKRPGVRYQLCLRPLNPMRIRTPRDKRKTGRIVDGVELNRYSEPEALWIKRNEPGKVLTDTAKNFVRVPLKRGHRWLALHDFITDNPEEFRGTSPLASCIKGFKDLSDFLNAELVSNVVTAAFSLFIELQAGQSPMNQAGNLASFYDANPAGESARQKQTRYQELTPGSILYGNLGEKPHPISANRPGATFEPFVREIKKSFAHGLGLPYPVAFKDVDGISHAGFRSAMLEAWRVFNFRREHHGAGNCHKVRKMLMEEAHLMGDLKVPGGTTRFYKDMDALCNARWVGPPKGDIEPYKQAKADFLKWDYNTKTLERVIQETDGGNPTAVIRQAKKEKQDLGAAAPGQSQAGADSELAGQASAEDIALAVAELLEERK